MRSMFVFFLRKNVYDAWDAVYSIIILNAVLAGLIAFSLWLTLRAGFHWAYAAVPAIFAWSLWQCAAACLLRQPANFETLSLAQAARRAKTLIVPALLLGLARVFVAASAYAAFVVYGSHGGAAGVFAAGLSFWFLLGLCLIGNYIPPLLAENGVTLRAVCREAAALFFEAPFFSLGLAAYNVLCVALSPFAAFLLPGPAAALLSSSIALRIRRAKFAWLKKRFAAGLAAKPCPWDELLAADTEMLGTRTLRDFIFPWKT